MVFFPLLIGLVLASEPDPLHEAEATFDEGVRTEGATARAAFARAAQGYATVRERGIFNASLARNEGTAWLLAGDVPRALRAFRAGLRVAHADRALQHGLLLARDQVDRASAGPSGVPPAEHWPLVPLGWLAFGAWLLFCASCVLLTLGVLTRTPNWFWLSGCCLLVTIPMTLSWHATLHGANQTMVIIAHDATAVYSGNGTSYPVHPFTLNRGIEAKLLHDRGPWLQVELSGGLVGWVPRLAVLFDYPMSPLDSITVADKPISQPQSSAAP